MAPKSFASISVELSWRGQGIGSALIERLIALQDGPIHLMCQSSLGPLYERFGFVRIERDEMPKYFRRVSQLAGVLDSLRAQGETLLIMRHIPRTRRMGATTRRMGATTRRMDERRAT